jgi:hypothetical protein
VLEGTNNENDVVEADVTWPVGLILLDGSSCLLLCIGLQLLTCSFNSHNTY